MCYTIFQVATGNRFSYDLVESLEQYYHSRRSLDLSLDKTIRAFCSDSTFDVRKLIWIGDIQENQNTFFSIFFSRITSSEILNGGKFN